MSALHKIIDGLTAAEQLELARRAQMDGDRGIVPCGLRLLRKALREAESGTEPEMRAAKPARGAEAEQEVAA